MKRLAFFVALLLTGALLISPVFAITSDAPQAAQTIQDDQAVQAAQGTEATGEIVEIQEEEVPMSAIPLGFVNESSGTGNRSVMTLIGGVLTVVSGAGIIYTVWTQRRQHA